MTNPLYFVETQGRRARWFIECDRDTNSRKHVIGLIRTGEVSPVKVLEIDEESGSCRDVTDELKAEAMARVFPDVPKIDIQAARFDRARDLRKHEVVS